MASPVGDSAAPARRRVLVEEEALYPALAAQLVAQELCRRLEVADSVSLFLSGGSTPGPTYRRLARCGLDWRRVELFWGDERCVSPEDPRSNYSLARSELLEPAGIEAVAVHRIPAELGAEEAARRYEAELRAHFGGPEARPDVVLLGLGEDGHTASLFSPPDDGAEPRESDAWVVATESPRPPRARVSLSADFLASAARVVFLVTGEAKAGIVAAVLAGEAETAAAAVERRAERVLWILDEAAAVEWRAAVVG